FTRSTTEAINLVAYAWGRATIRSGDEIILTEMEHHSNLVPWQLLAAEKGAKLRFIPFDGQGQLQLDVYERLLSPRTKLVALAHQSNVLGTINPVKEIAARAPFHGGGEMIMLVQLETSTYKEPPHKFEAGTPNIADCIVWGEAAEYLQGIGMGAIREHEKRLTAYALHALGDVPGLTVFGPRDVEDRGGVVAFTLEGVHPHDVAQVLDQEGIAVRAGHHCTQPLHRRLGVAATTRASLYL